MNLPANIDSARLPATYEAARVALSECVRVDECQEWADKAAALASYARQADDTTLEAYAKRIRGRVQGTDLLQCPGRRFRHIFEIECSHIHESCQFPGGVFI